jgi:hypothetical protein
MSVTQIAKRKSRETWREAVAARAEAAGEPACLTQFDTMMGEGRSEAEAAYRSLAAHGLLWSLPETGTAPAIVPSPTDRHDVPEV